MGCGHHIHFVLKQGFVFLVAIMDLFSRYIVSWRIFNTLEPDFCGEALKEALEQGKPEYFNTDQDSQFTYDGFTSILKSEKIQISMDGKVRVIDNIFIVQRLHQSLKEYDMALEAYLQTKLAVAC